MTPRQIVDRLHSLPKYVFNDFDLSVKGCDGEFYSGGGKTSTF